MQLLPEAKDFFATNRKKFLSRNIAFFFDFDGTLADITPTPEETTLPRETIDHLKTLSHFSQGKVAIVSGRPMSFLTSIFNNDLILVAEHGVESNYLELIEKKNLKNGPPIGEVEFLQSLVDKYPFSSIENKPHSLVWHFRLCQELVPPILADTLSQEINNRLVNTGYECRHYNAVLELKPRDFNKAQYAQMLLESFHDHFVIAFGDDTTEEEMFLSFPKDRAVSVAVGTRISHATYHCPTPLNLRQWVKQISREWELIY